jgi:hypothetical protein
MRKLEGNEVWFHYGGALSKRLYEISRYDNYISDSERKSAAELLEIVKETMERASPLNPEKYRLYLEANAYMEEQVRFIGGWFIGMDAQRIPDRRGDGNDCIP